VGDSIKAYMYFHIESKRSHGIMEAVIQGVYDHRREGFPSLAQRDNDRLMESRNR
jgi:hypothetical protein